MFNSWYNHTKRNNGGNMKERLSVSVPKELIPKLKELAKKEKRNVSNLVAVLLEEAVENKKAA